MLWRGWHVRSFLMPPAACPYTLHLRDYVPGLLWFLR